LRQSSGVLGAGAGSSARQRPVRRTPAARTPEDCRKAYWTGRYDLAAEGFAKLVEAGDSPAAIAQADALAIQGEYAEALKALEGVAKQGDARADWRLAMAEACQRLGQYEKALEHVVRSRAIRDDWAPSLFVHGDLLETLGCEKEAINVYREMNKIIDAGKCLADPRSLVALGKILDRLAILTGRPASDQAQNILSNYFEKAYHDVGKEYWPANVAAGMFLLSKHKPAQAENEFKKAEKWNPRIPDVKAAYALMSLESWKFEDCLAQAEKALSINPNHDLALYAQAACYMQWRKFERVPPILEKILAVNPNHVDALSLMAAAQIRMDRPDQARLFEDRVRKINPRCATPPLTIGQWLEAGRQYDQAKRYLRQAHELAPHLAEPLAELGKIHMQTGEEEQATWLTTSTSPES
jgi:tetratricopeptide (TPR) repeat protein